MRFWLPILELDTAWLAGDDADVGRLRLTEDQLMRLATDQHGKPLDGVHLARHLSGVLETWGAVVRDLRREATVAAASQISNPFRAGEPLTPEQGHEVFRGREILVRQIEGLLA